jgi:DNA-binding MarR family transcriptional regulator
VLDGAVLADGERAGHAAHDRVELLGGGVRGGDGGDGLARDAREDARGLQRGGDVVHEEDQHPDADDGQGDAEHDGERRDEALAVVVAAVDGAQDAEAVGEDPDEGAEGELVRTVAEEVAQDARRVLARRLGDGDHRQREGEPRDGDHPARHVGEDRARAAGAGAEHARPPRERLVVHVGRQLHRAHGQAERRGHDQARHEPERAEQAVAKAAQAPEHRAERRAACAGPPPQHRVRRPRAARDSRRRHAAPPTAPRSPAPRAVPARTASRPSADRAPTRAPARDRARDRHRDTADALDSLRRVVRALRVAAASGESATGLSAAQLFVLQVVHAEPGLSLTEVAARTLTDRTSVAAAVERLAARGLVERRRGEADRRRVALVPTPAARRVLAAAPHPPTRRVLDGLAAVDDRTLRRIALGLTALVRAMGLDAEPAPMLFDDGAG